MIHYMPFTYLRQDLISRLAVAVGSFAVCQVSEALVPSTMKAWINKGTIVPQWAEGVNADQVLKAMDAFNQWGDVHQDRLAAMAGLSMDGGDRIPMVNESAPTRISNLIRHYKTYENRDATAKSDPLFRAALFLAMAQRHDEDQDAVTGTLADVRRMEARMAAQLTGDLDTDLPGALIPDSGAGPAGGSGRDNLWIDQRIVAWATMACRLTSPAHLYLTTSRAVSEALVAQLPAVVRLGQKQIDVGALDTPADSTTGVGNLGVLAEALATAPEPLDATSAWETEAPGQGNTSPNPATSAWITFWALPGQHPQPVLAGLSGQASIDLPVAAPEIRNTVFGHLAF